MPPRTDGLPTFTDGPWPTPYCQGASHQLAPQGELGGAQQDLVLEEFRRTPREAQGSFVVRQTFEDVAEILADLDADVDGCWFSGLLVEVG